jgi:hypothetical protein
MGVADLAGEILRPAGGAADGGGHALLHQVLHLAAEIGDALLDGLEVNARDRVRGHGCLLQKSGTGRRVA